ncbi:MAG TPA: DUF3795 domain-containing protein [Candidatus Cloacimonadota bacterium]|nr:DUF3795 domain-containing protein [Candidatus Cloacimonadota bacterium]HOV16509.1 DUF3795 domain-containing protein [Candidatus Cloacimonadota bacterium]HQL15262.1 DUF3795 domain-containing protein [Candidatus Cloacimonadota bacterium]
MEKLIAACGIDCSKCEARQATIANDNALRTAVAEKWSQRYDIKLTADNINCLGCIEPGVKFAHCYECDIRACVRSKGLKNCAECADYPCAMLQEFLAEVPDAKANLEELRH